MKAMLSATVIHGLPPGNYDVWDTGQSSLVLRVRLSGKHSYLASLGRGRWFTLGRADVLVPKKARELCRDKLVEMADGLDPISEKRRKRAATFSLFLDKQYEPWAVANLKSAPSVMARLRKQFEPIFGDKPLTAIDPFAVERWRADRFKVTDGKRIATKATTNRDLGALRACLSKAVAWGALRDHPLRQVRQGKEDRSATVRYLTPAEETRLRDALKARDDKRRTERESANTFRRERGYPTLPECGTYADHLTPFVLLALNTGLRRGEIFNLRWRDVDLVGANLTVGGQGAKSGRTRHVPLHEKIVAVVKAWRPEGVSPEAYVFPGDEGKPMTSLKTSWMAIAKAAKLKHFRFHDTRHTFASKLVQAGVDLATVRELLGHSDFALTLRYAHLAAENKVAAVQTLVGKA